MSTTTDKDNDINMSDIAKTTNTLDDGSVQNLLLGQQQPRSPPRKSRTISESSANASGMKEKIATYAYIDKTRYGVIGEEEGEEDPDLIA